MKIALITLSREGAVIAGHLAAGLPGASVYVHQDADPPPGAHPFARVTELTGELFGQVGGLVYIAPCGVAVRALAPCAKHKTSDPAVVVVDVGGRWAVSLLSGHEGGANDLAMAVANLLDAEPVISTTTETLKTYIIGVGCRRGTAADQIAAAAGDALRQADVPLEQVRLLASADVKRDEPGLQEAARQLKLPLRFVSSDEIRASQRDFVHSDFVEEKVNLPAVAEPAALLAGRRTQLVLPKQRYFSCVTIAIARESCMWSA